MPAASSRCCCAMYGSSCANWFGLDREALDGLRIGRPMTIEARNQTPRVSPSGQSIAGERRRRRGTPPPAPEIDGQHVVGQELGVLVGEADARRDAAACCRRARACRAGSRTRPTAGTGRRGPRGGRGPASRRPARRAPRRPGTAPTTRSSAVMTRPLNRPWTRRRNGSWNRKKPMSRPKIGSVTAVRRPARTAPGCSRAGPSPRPRPASRRRRGRSAPTRPTRTHAGDRRQVRQVVGVEGDRRADRRSPGGAPAARSAGAPASAASAASLSRSTSVADRPPAVGRRRRQAAGEPQVAEQHDEGEHEPDDEQHRPARRSASSTRASKPTLWYHSASVQRSIPNAEQQRSAR